MIGMARCTGAAPTDDPAAADHAERAWRQVGPGGTVEWDPHRDATAARSRPTSARRVVDVGSAVPSRADTENRKPVLGTSSPAAPAVVLSAAVVLMMYQDQPFALVRQTSIVLTALFSPVQGGQEQDWWVLLFGMDLASLTFTFVPLAALLCYAFVTRRR
ncbi:hypothetical protein FHR81_000026 [Actinoalloteichus hoggarensis]|uniref:Uncharacterized protein n=1 Tax=Actinoalloteichus hoggarensis TaxID=1470176 RepID=A0A221W3R2_9PSEU|nr:hypothetical protein [Actinoalloteichus hoggarensis]ASO20289.1 hypothetical protein AHOG_13230 [Actinoalloteichus hoggarensis]MBB5918997.1 hypothetical protein [Actinoalloteichus hoggarensis]